MGTGEGAAQGVVKKKREERALGSVLEELRGFKHGADPIEAMHGHVCGPDCWHQQMMSAYVWLCNACWVEGCEEKLPGRIFGSHQCGGCGREVPITENMRYTKRADWEVRRSNERRR